jgi:L-fuculose-phosphate aldolase
MKAFLESKEMSTNEDILRREIVESCQRLYQRNLLAAGDGNVSIKIGEERILFTPSGRPKAFVAPSEITIAKQNGEVVAGQPSGEREMHLSIYRRCPEARAVVHAHPPYAVAWSLARPELRELPGEFLAEVILGAGRIPIVPYQRATTAAMGEALLEFLPSARALILARHGAVCWGETLEEAMNGMERLEHSAQILWLAESLGGAKPLPADEVQALREMRARMGAKLL